MLGISVGAIASNYQRLRVESVASWLGCTVLAYLWEREQRSLLSEMVSNGVDAILIKVAAVGLTTRHLGQSLAAAQQHLLRLNDRFQVHPCGEGGEYETLVLDCPLFRSRVHVERADVVDLGEGTAHLKVHAVLEQKEKVQDDGWKRRLLESSQLEPRYRNILPHEGAESQKILLQSTRDSRSDRSGKIASLARQSRGDLEIMRIVVRDDEPLQLTDMLPPPNTDAFVCVLVLRSMDDFAAVNAAYGRLWTGAHPPARVCIAAPFDDASIRFVLHVVRRTRPDGSASSVADVNRRQAGRRLWVQSRSHWAPANIGPYSQSVTTGLLCSGGSGSHSHELAFVSGQIGLVPSSLHLAPTFVEQVRWSLHSLARVVTSQKLLSPPTPLDAAASVLVAYVLSAEHIDSVVHAAEQAGWTGALTGHAEDEGEDEDDNDNDGDHGTEAGTYTAFADSTPVRHDTQLLVVVLAPGSSLPRGAAVEWQLLASRALREAADDDGGDNDDHEVAVCSLDDCVDHRRKSTAVRPDRPALAVHYARHNSVNFGGPDSSAGLPLLSFAKTSAGTELDPYTVPVTDIYTAGESVSWAQVVYDG